MSDRISLAELRALNTQREDAPVYRPVRQVSIRLSYLCVRAGVPANALTILGVVVVAAAAALLATGSTSAVRAAGVLVILAYVLDCMDGEVARGSFRPTVIGTQLDHLSNWLTIGLLQAGAAVGAYQQTGGSAELALGYSALAGWYSFYFLFIQLRVWVPPRAAFRRLRRLSRWLFATMPLDENLLIAFALTGAVVQYVWVSAILAPALFFLTLAAYLAEAGDLRSTPDPSNAKEGT